MILIVLISLLTRYDNPIRQLAVIIMYDNPDKYIHMIYAGVSLNDGAAYVLFLSITGLCVSHQR